MLSDHLLFIPPKITSGRYGKEPKSCLLTPVLRECYIFHHTFHKEGKFQWIASSSTLHMNYFNIKQEKMKSKN